MPTPKNNPTKAPKKPVKKIINPAMAIFTTLDDISQKLSALIKQNSSIQTMQDQASEKKNKTDLPDFLTPPTEPYDKVANILKSQPISSDDPLSDIYQREYIYDILKRKGQNVHLVNDGPGLLFVIATSDGITWTNETFLLEGEHKIYNTLYELGLRSPTAGLTYRVSERELMNQSGQIFSGSRVGDRRDRKGVIVFQDNFESQTEKFIPTISGGGSVTRSITTAYQGSFSLNVTAGTLNAQPASFFEYDFVDFHIGKVGHQIRFAVPNNNTPFTIIRIQLIFNGSDGTFIDALIQIDNSGAISIEDPSGSNFIQVAQINQLSVGINLWQSLKFVVDLSTGFYDYFILNGIIFDLSSHKMHVIPGFAVPTGDIEVLISVINQNPLLGSSTVFFDNYIFTEDEP